MVYQEAILRNEKEIIGILDPLVKEWFFSKPKDFNGNWAEVVANKIKSFIRK